MSIKDQWRKMRDAEDAQKEFKYNRNDLVTRFAVVLQMARPDTSDDDALRIAKSLCSTTIGEFRWLDVCEEEEYDRNH